VVNATCEHKGDHIKWLIRTTNNKERRIYKIEKKEDKKKYVVETNEL